MQLSEHLEDAGDLAPRRGFGPALAGAGQERAEVAVTRVLEREAVENLTSIADAFGTQQRKPVEHGNRPRMAVQELPEVRLAQPPVDVGAHFDADVLGDDRRVTEPPREIDLAEPALAEQPLDAVPELRFRAGDDLFGREQMPHPAEGAVDRSDRASGGSG